MSEPEPIATAMGTFCRLKSEQREALVSALERANPAISLDELAKAVGHSTHIDVPLVEGVLDAVWRLVPVAVADRSFLDPASEYLLSVGLDGRTRTAGDDVLLTQLKRLLLCERSIAISGKAQAVLWGHGRIFQGGHVLTQIRPLFAANLDAKAPAAVIVHECRIDYREGDQRRELCVALDRGQIRDLVVVLTRAIKKEDSLRRDGSFAYLFRPTPE